MKKKIILGISTITVTVFLVYFIGSNLAYGGECMPSSFGHSFYQSEDVFVGKVISKNNSTSLPATATLEVEEVFKGSHNKTMTLSDVEFDDTMHQHVLFSMAKKYLVFATGHIAFGCTYTHEITDSFEKERSKLKTLAIIDTSNNLSPVKQLKLGIEAEDVKCKKGFFLAIRERTNGLTPACLMHETWIKMANDRHWRPIG